MKYTFEKIRSALEPMRKMSSLQFPIAQAGKALCLFRMVKQASEVSGFIQQEIMKIVDGDGGKVQGDGSIGFADCENPGASAKTCADKINGWLMQEADWTLEPIRLSADTLDELNEKNKDATLSPEELWALDGFVEFE